MIIVFGVDPSGETKQDDQDDHRVLILRSSSAKSFRSCKLIKAIKMIIVILTFGDHPITGSPDDPMAGSSDGHRVLSSRFSVLSSQ
jgi:hypothetical protein